MEFAITYEQLLTLLLVCPAALILLIWTALLGFTTVELYIHERVKEISKDG